jgi:hypothetical protein
MRHLRVAYSEVREMPIMYRTWFINRYVKELEQRADALKKSTQAAASPAASNTIHRAARAF